MEIPKELEPFFNVTMVYGSLVFCEVCNREAEYNSGHPQYEDANYLDQAIEMKRSGWTVTTDLKACCPSCRNGLPVEDRH